MEENFLKQKCKLRMSFKSKDNSVTTCVSQLAEHFPFPATPRWQPEAAESVLRPDLV